MPALLKYRMVFNLLQDIACVWVNNNVYLQNDWSFVSNLTIPEVVLMLEAKGLIKTSTTKMLSVAFFFID